MGGCSSTQVPSNFVTSVKVILTTTSAPRETLVLGSVVKRTVLVVVSLPQFTVKPPEKVVAVPGDSLTLNCSATGDPQPVISWKRQGAPLQVGRSQQINGALVVRDTRENDTGNYICAATSGGVFQVENEHVTYVEVKIPRGKFSQQTFSKANAE